jgi:hypothetical protein
MAERAILIVSTDNATVEASSIERRHMQAPTVELDLRVSRRGRRRAPLAFDINLCCSYSCSSVVLRA